MKSKYFVGSIIHRVLERIIEEPATDRQLCRLFSKESMPKFARANITPLIEDGFVNRAGEFLIASPRGKERYQMLGPVTVKKDKKNRGFFYELYAPKEFFGDLARTGSSDHEKYPSRRGQTLVWRNGLQMVMQ
jgi:hypothetical protein